MKQERRFSSCEKQKLFQERLSGSGERRAFELKKGILVHEMKPC
jgi:hypothetical protein